MPQTITIQFPEKRSLGSLYTAEEQFPHPRKWIGEAKGTLALSFPDGRMLGVALGAFGWEALNEASSAQLQCIRSIDFSTSQFCAKTVKSLSALGELTEIRLDFLKFNDEELSSLTTFPGLKTIWLTGTSISDRAIAALSELPALVNLVLKNTKVTDAGLAELRSDSLQSLTLPSQITNAGLSNLQHVPNLCRLDLSNTSVTNEGLSALKTLTKLEEVYLNDTAVTDAGVPQLSQLKSLKTLFLSGTKVSDASVPHFESMSSLEHLELRDTGVTEIAAARIRAKLPGCAVFGG